MRSGWVNRELRCLAWLKHENVDDDFRHLNRICDTIQCLIGQVITINGFSNEYFLKQWDLLIYRHALCTCYMHSINVAQSRMNVTLFCHIRGILLRIVTSLPILRILFYPHGYFNGTHVPPTKRKTRRAYLHHCSHLFIMCTLRYTYADYISHVVFN